MDVLLICAFRFTSQMLNAVVPQVISAFAVGRVIRSKDSNYKEGDIVLNPFFPVAEYIVVPSAAFIRKVDPVSGVPLPDYLSSLGNSSCLVF